METAVYSVEKLAPGLCFPMGKEGTWWRVLEVNAEKWTVLVIADWEICEKVYNEKYEDITWEQCSIRKWLNGEYYEEIFSEEEKEAIIECEVKNSYNAKYSTRGGADTKDMVWLLSLDEAEKYFKNDEDRATGSWWWLRSPGFGQRLAAYVDHDGSVYVNGFCVYYEGGVRPAFLLNLNSSFFKRMFEDENNLIIKVPAVFTVDHSVKSVNPGVKKY